MITVVNKQATFSTGIVHLPAFIQVYRRTQEDSKEKIESLGSRRIEWNRWGKLVTNARTEDTEGVKQDKPSGGNVDEPG